MPDKDQRRGNNPHVELDATDRMILQILQSDAKKNIKEISAETGITKTPIYERIKRLERTGVISKYVALINSKKATSSLMVFCAVTLDVQKADFIEDFAASVSEMPEVMECYLAGGQFDFLLKVIVRDLDAYHEFASHRLAALPNVSTIKSSFVLSEYKHSTVFPLI